MKSSNLSGQVVAGDNGAKLMYIEPEEGFGVTQCSANGNVLYMSAYGESGNWLNNTYGIRLRGYDGGYAAFYPDNDNNHKVDLGTSSFYWRNAYITNLYISGHVYVNGTQVH